MGTENEAKGCLAAILQLFTGKGHARSAAFPYRLKDDFLSPAELSFYHVLTSVVQGQLVVMGKVRLADIFYVTQKDGYFSHFNRISQRHVDFLLCQPETMRPVVAIELDDASHNRRARKERDAFVDTLFRAASLPLLRVPVRRTYSAQEIAERLAPYLSGAASVRKSPTLEVGAEQHNDATPPSCPKCGAPMVLRTVKKGPHQGKRFYGCTNFPNCRGILPLRAADD